MNLSTLKTPPTCPTNGVHLSYGRFLYRCIQEYEPIINLHLENNVALKHYRIQKNFEGNIELMPGETTLPPAWITGGAAKPHNEITTLSLIINILNERFKPDSPFTSTDQILFDQIIENMTLDEDLAAQAATNPIENYQYGFDAKWEEKLIDLMDRNHEIFRKIVDDPEFGDALKGLIMSKVYKQQRSNHTSNTRIQTRNA